MNLKVYGIRHHGPGSAKNLIAALHKQCPDIVLVEGPEDVNESLAVAGEADMVPPVALMVYNVKDLKDFSVYPFAVFSPEWQAFQYAFKAGVSIKCIDLPVSMLLGLQDEKQAEIFAKEDRTGGRFDPLAEIAGIAGFDEVESWWEHTFEQWDEHEEIFDVILEMMSVMREASPGLDHRETLVREAFMRKQIRKTIKEGYQNIAVVCGAWHAPVLAGIKQFSSAGDNALLRGIQKVKTAAAWVPWTYERLSRASGYGAGVKAPFWYALLFEERSDVATKWMVKAAQLMREKDGFVSAAHAVEASGLANTLAIMRGIPVPGLRELKEAVLAVLCEGKASRMEAIEKRLVIGDVLGKICKKAPVLPLQKDLESQVKQSRLSKEYENAGEHFKEFDLRKDTNLNGSILLRRLRLLGLFWGIPMGLEGNPLGSFKERWKLKWEPDYAALLIKASPLGSTIKEAALGKVEQLVTQTKDLKTLVMLVADCLHADLGSAIQKLGSRIETLAVATDDIRVLLETFPSLVNAYRYGSTRKIDVLSIEILITAYISRILTGLPEACVGLSEEQSREVSKYLQEIQSSLLVLDWGNYIPEWEQTLRQIEKKTGVSPLLKGLVTRLLFDRGIWGAEIVSVKMAYGLSNIGLQSFSAALWLEGFISNSGLLLIYQPELWDVLDTWVDNLPIDIFQAILPILRRTFSSFSDTESRYILQLAQGGNNVYGYSGSFIELDQERGEIVLPILKELLGS